MRRMSLADLDEVTGIERLIYPYPWTPGNFRDSVRSGYQCWVLNGGEAAERAALPVIAYCVMMQVLDEAHLMNLSVAQSMQRRGLGRWMLRWLMDLAARHGARGMFLEVRPSNTAARDLYRQEGFEQIGLRRHYYPNGNAGREDAVVMRRDLGTTTGGADVWQS